MNIIQFKRKNSQNNTNSPELTAGEMFIFPSEEKIRIGKQEGTSTSAAGTYFEIKAKPNCLYTSTGVAQNTIVGLQASSSAGKIQYRQMNSDGTLGAWTDLSANVSTNAASADKLNTNAGKDGGSGVMNPIYFGSGIPKAMTGTIGSSTKPVYINNGKIAECNTMLTSLTAAEDTSNKWYLYGNNNLQSVISLKYNKSIYTQNSKLYTKYLNIQNNTFDQSEQSQPLLGRQQNGDVAVVRSVGSLSKPIYIDNNGAPRECTLNVPNIINYTKPSSGDWSITTSGKLMSSFIPSELASGHIWIMQFVVQPADGRYTIILDLTQTPSGSSGNYVWSTESKGYYIRYDTSDSRLYIYYGASKAQGTVYSITKIL